MNKAANHIMTFAVLISLAGCGDSIKTVDIPQGTSLRLSLESYLSTETSHNGDRIVGTTLEPIIIDDDIVIPAGATVHGMLTGVRRSGATNDRATMTLNFNEVVVANEHVYSINTIPIVLEGKPDTKQDAERVAGAAVAGAVVGGIAKGGKGSIIGALAGAGAGGVWAVATKGNQIILERGQKLELTTAEPVELPIVHASTL